MRKKSVFGTLKEKIRRRLSRVGKGRRKHVKTGKLPLVLNSIATAAGKRKLWNGLGRPSALDQHFSSRKIRYKTDDGYDRTKHAFAPDRSKYDARGNIKVAFV